MDRFEKGYATDLIVGKIETDNISVKRGQTLEIPVTFEHLSNTSTSKDVTLTNFHNAFRNFAPSANEGLDDAEFMKLIRENESVRGEIKMEEVTVSPSTVTISPKATTTVIMTVTVPQDLPVEMTGKSITIGLGFDISPESTEIRGVGPSVTLVVTE
jgi:hypothetical protein